MLKLPSLCLIAVLAIFVFHRNAYGMPSGDESEDDTKGLCCCCCGYCLYCNRDAGINVEKMDQSPADAFYNGTMGENNEKATCCCCCGWCLTCGKSGAQLLSASSKYFKK